MTKIKLIIINSSHVFIALAVLALLISCGNDTLTGEESPDKSKIALAYVKRIGPSHTYISIQETKTKKETDLFKMKGVVPVSFKWINDKELNIYIPDKTLIKNTIGTVNNIKINVVEENKSSHNKLLQSDTGLNRFDFHSILISPCA